MLFWPLLEERLRIFEAKLAAGSCSSADVTPVVSRDTSMKIDDIDFPMTPVPTSFSKISVTGPINCDQIMDNVVKNYVDHHMKLSFSTFKIIQNIYATISREINEDFSEERRKICRQKALEILLIISKLDLCKLVSFYLKQKEKVQRYPDVSTAEKECAFIKFIEPALSELHLSLTSTSFEIRRLDIAAAERIKHFLHLPAILEAFHRCLEKVDIRNDEESIKEAINVMNIYQIYSLPNFRGISVRDGIVLVEARNLAELTGDSAPARDKASIFTVACHETIHYLARYFSNDYNFSSPGQLKRKECDIAGVGGTSEGKVLELGQLVELILFGGVQPKWNLSNPSAAEKFLSNSSVLRVGPLVCPDPLDEYYLFRRTEVSLSGCNFEAEEIIIH